MLDYTFLKIAWWLIMGFVLILYATTAGYDAGVTMIMAFLRKETDRRVVLNTSAPVWDGNLSWIVFAGGGLFVIWPAVYSTAFSGMYAAMLCILWSLFFRPTGFDYRSKINHHRWRRFWDFGLLVSGGLPVFIFGLAMGNCLLGFPFHFDTMTWRDYYTGNFFDLFNGFALLSGFASLLMVLMHGSAYLQQHTEGHLRELARKLFFIFGILLFIFFSIAGIDIALGMQGYTLIASPVDATLYPADNIVSHTKGAWLASYSVYPWKYYPPIIAYVALMLALWANYVRKVVLCFWSSVFTVGGMVATVGATIFPFLMPSSTNPSQSLTVWNSTSTQYALNIMLYVASILFVVIFFYKLFAFRTIWAKKRTITETDLEENEHHFY